MRLFLFAFAALLAFWMYRHIGVYVQDQLNQITDQLISAR
jgi:hypothetical protein